ncbi:MAG: alpha/beta hydrolase [Streptosporangiales bacterium]|nr:alpha/beta hydrolase [Streptosporangiales bacterium]
MGEQVPTVLIPGLMCSPRLYAEQLPALWRFGPVTVAGHRGADSVKEIAGQILAAAPPKFSLAGLSMGGYVALEIMRQAADRVARLALVDTSARPDTPDKTAGRRDQMALAEAGRLGEVTDILYPRWVGPARRDDPELRWTVRQMADETGPEAFVRQQTAIMNRPDSRPGLSAIDCQTLVVAGVDDEVTPLDCSEEIANGIPSARLLVIPDCGHLSTLEQPKILTTALTAWLSQ